MCGIIGIVKKDNSNITENLVRSLIDLEYRGYDSAGVVVVHNSKLKIESIFHVSVNTPAT